MAPQEFDATYEAFLSYVNPDDTETVKKAVGEALQEKKPYSIEHRVVRPDGTERVVHERAEIMFDNAGKAIRMVGTVHDITERKLAEKEIRENLQMQHAMNLLLHISLKDIPLNEQLEYTLDVILSLPFLPLEPKGGIFLVEDQPDVLVLRANQNLSVPIQEMCSRVPFGRCLCGRAAESRRIEFADCLDHRHENRYEGITPHGHYSVPILSKGKVLGVIVLYLQDGHPRVKQEIEFLQAVGNTLAGVIERKRAEEKLKDYSEKLERKVRERTKELEVAERQAVTANRAKSGFLSSMSHELRTPLTSVIGFAGVLRDEFFGKLNEKQREYVNNIYDSGRHLLNLVNDILDLSKVESGKMELDVSRCLLRNALETAVTMLKEKAMKHNIKLSLEIGPDADIEIEADERKLKQILFNLLSNAVKFTPDGGSVRLTARQIKPSESEADADLIEISVKDTGIGIKAGDIPELFKEFTQLDSTYTKKYEGTGLGLALTKSLIVLHGGWIWVESEWGKGSAFRFIIPCKAKQPVELIINPVTKLLTWEHLVTHIKRAQSSYNKRSGEYFGLLRIDLTHINKSEDHFSIVEALKNIVRKNEIFSQGNEWGCYYLVIFNANRRIVEDTALRIAALLKKIGYTPLIKTALFMEDGEDLGELLETLNNRDKDIKKAPAKD